MKRLTFGVLLVVLTAGSIFSDSGSSRKWKQVDEKYFTFEVPDNFEKIVAQGVDSYVGRYKSEPIDLNFDYGPYSDPLEYPNKPFNYKERVEKINGWKAKIVTYSKSGLPENIMAVHFPNGGLLIKGGNKLTLSCTCKSEKDFVVVERIIKSIKFKGKE